MRTSVVARRDTARICGVLLSVYRDTSAVSCHDDMAITHDILYRTYHGRPYRQPQVWESRPRCEGDKMFISCFVSCSERFKNNCASCTVWKNGNEVEGKKKRRRQKYVGDGEEENDPDGGDW